MAFDPSIAKHGFEGSGEGCAVDGEDVAELLLVDRAGEGERLQDGELGAAEAGGTDGLVVEEGEDAGCASEGGAGARESGDGGVLHGHLDVYTYIFGRRFF